MLEGIPRALPMRLAWPNMRDSRSIIVDVQEEAQTYRLLLMA